MSSKIIAGTTAGTALNMSADTSGILEIQTGSTPTTAVTIDASQNVGIGTTSPAYKLEVNGGAVAGFMRLASTANPTGFDMGVGGSGDPTAYIYNRNNTPLLFATNNTERMRIDSSGNLLVGSATALGTPRVFIKNTTGNANNPVIILQAQATSVATTMLGFYDGDATFCGQVYIDPAANTTIFATSSDYRLKENVAPMAGALDKVSALNPVTYEWVKSGKSGQGFIAHELQAVVPECVIGEKDAIDEEGNILPQMIDTSFLVATLTAAIQELKQELDATKAEVAALKGAK